MWLCSCSSIKQNSQEWQVIYPNPKDSTIVQVQGLYTSKGKLLYNNKNESNINKECFDNDFLFKPTSKQIKALEEFVIQYKLANNPIYKNDTSKVLQKYKKYGRIYTGYMCVNKDSIFILTLIEKPGNIKHYQCIPVILSEPGAKVPEISTFFINLSKNIRTNTSDYYDPCIPIKVQE